MAEITSFEQQMIDGVAKRHDSGQEEMSAELKRVQGVVMNTLQASTSQQTKALADVYDSWFKDVEAMIVQRCSDLTNGMRTTASEQTASDESNASAMLAFLN